MWTHPMGDATPEFSAKCEQYRLFIFLIRLQFYLGRYHKRIAIDVAKSIEKTRVNFGGIADVAISKELDQRMVDIDIDLALLEDGLNDLDCVRDPGIVVEDISTPLEDPDQHDCVVCKTGLTPPGVRTKPCQHIYCKACLEAWIHIGENSSHTCGYCRTELFPQIPRQPKDSEADDDYQTRDNNLKADWKDIEMLKTSLVWFKHEMRLQRDFEREVGLLRTVMP